MDHFFSNSDNEEETNIHLDLDQLYDKRRQIEQLRLGIYKKILNRVHLKIKHVAKQRNGDHYLFYVVPEFVFGIPKYNVSTCISYIIEQLTDNGFDVKYTHPNLLFISWMHYIPSYQREQIKKQTGKTVDGFGNIIKTKKSKNILNLGKEEDPSDINRGLFNNREPAIKSPKKKKDYRDISTYKNTGIYNVDLLSKLNEKLQN